MVSSTVNIFVKPMVNPSLFSSEINIVPKLNKIDKSIHAYLVKDIATDSIDFKMYAGTLVYFNE